MHRIGTSSVHGSVSLDKRGAGERLPLVGNRNILLVQIGGATQGGLQRTPR